MPSSLRGSRRRYERAHQAAVDGPGELEAIARGDEKRAGQRQPARRNGGRAALRGARGVARR